MFFEKLKGYEEKIAGENREKIVDFIECFLTELHLFVCYERRVKTFRSV